MVGFNVLPAHVEAMVHRGLQANLMAVATRPYTSMHIVFGMGWVIHGALQIR